MAESPPALDQGYHSSDELAGLTFRLRRWFAAPSLKGSTKHLRDSEEPQLISYRNDLESFRRAIGVATETKTVFRWPRRKARRKERESPATEQEHKLYLEEAVLERKIPETDLRQLVELPPGLGYQEWLASHTIDFFQHINLVYGTIAEFCTMSGCSDMSGPATRPYLWFDEKGKKVRVAAPQYIDYVMTFTQKTINDESIFPTKFENEFPVSFESIVKKIHRLLFHVIAHLYHSHFRELVLLSLHAHLNCIFAHFTLFNERFRLIDEKETEILHDLVLALRLHPEDREAAARQAAEGGDDASSTTGEDGVRHCTSAEGEAADGRASPAVASTPGTDAAADEPQSAARLDDPLPSPSGGATSSSGPFISPDLADTRP